MSNIFETAAPVYARELKWHALPLAVLGKIPCIKDWVNQATADLEVIAGWASQFPNANVGIATGSKSGFWVLDVDPGNGGLESLAKLEAQYGALPLTAKQQTGSGGFHYLFQIPDSFQISNSAGKLGPGLDIRGDGGQIVVAPSRSAKGAYRWVNAPWSVPPCPAPAWLLELLRPKAPSTVTVTAQRTFAPATAEVLEEARKALDAHGPAIEGHGGDAHTWQACALLANDFALTEAEALPLLEEWNQDCQPMWSLGDLKAKLRGGAQYASGVYGCKRKVDALGEVKALITAWQGSGSAQAGIATLVEASRRLIESQKVDPVVRNLIESELITATGVKSRALDLPRAFRRAEEGVVSSWAKLDVGPTGPLVNLNNVVTTLEQEKYKIHYDDFFQKIIITEKDGTTRVWTDAEDLNMTLQIQRNLGLARMHSSIVREGVIAYANMNRRNQVLEEYMAIEWDGVPRIETFFIRALGAPDDAYIRAASMNFLRSIMARLSKPGCKCDTMPVLEGPQGAFKSTALRALVGERLFSEVTEPLGSKDFSQCLVGKLLVEMGELSALDKAEIAQAKQTLSRPSDNYRKSYGHHSEDHPRQCVFAATTNETDWNRDNTGARRFWPIPCGIIDIPYIHANRVQLFAEAMHDVQEGLPWWEMPKGLTESIQEARRQVHPWEDTISTYISSKVEVTTSEILTELGVPMERRTKTLEMQVGSILKMLKWERKLTMRDGIRTRIWMRV